MRVEQRENSLGKSDVWQILVGAFRSVLNGIGQELQLIDQMRKEWLIDLGEFQFPLREMTHHLLHNIRRNRQCPSIYEIHDFCHAPDSSPRKSKSKSQITWL